MCMSKYNNCQWIVARGQQHIINISNITASRQRQLRESAQSLQRGTRLQPDRAVLYSIYRIYNENHKSTEKNRDTLTGSYKNIRELLTHALSSCTV